MKSVLAIDPSLVALGWCYQGKTGVLKPKHKEGKRLNEIYVWFTGFCDENQIKTIVMEGYSYGSHHPSTFLLAELGGMIKLFCERNDIDLIIIPPTTLKKFVCGKGNARKELMMVKTLKRFNIEFTDNNECDAFGLYMFYKTYKDFKSGVKIKKDDEEVFKKFEAKMK